MQSFMVSTLKLSLYLMTYLNIALGYLKANPTHSLLDAMVGYDLYIYSQGFTKKASKTLSPVGYVVLT